ncbi:hypothetical protein I4F81_007171 [Pyropia yezoensis]|nr:hypothetical protein I4F81_007171 [Neopyropia yezoensis]
MKTGTSARRRGVGGGRRGGAEAGGGVGSAPRGGCRGGRAALAGALTESAAGTVPGGPAVAWVPGVYFFAGAAARGYDQGAGGGVPGSGCGGGLWGVVASRIGSCTAAAHARRLRTPPGRGGLVPTPRGRCGGVAGRGGCFSKREPGGVGKTRGGWWRGWWPCVDRLRVVCGQCSQIIRPSMMGSVWVGFFFMPVFLFLRAALRALCGRPLAAARRGRPCMYRAQYSTDAILYRRLRVRARWVTPAAAAASPRRLACAAATVSSRTS